MFRGRRKAMKKAPSLPFEIELPVAAGAPGSAAAAARSVRPVRLTQQQLEAHLWGAANILRCKTSGQDYKNYILSLMFYKRLCDQWEHEADEAIAELEKRQGR